MKNETEDRIDDDENLPIAIFFDEGNRMDNDSFRSLVRNIIQCSSSQKIALISSSIHSLGDFIDMLEADCLFGNEFNALFNTLGEMELSILARIVFAEEIQNQAARFSSLSAGETELNLEWQIEYVRFLHNLNSDRLISIDKYIHSTFENE